MKQSIDQSQISSQIALTQTQNVAGQIVLTLLLAALVAVPFSILWGAGFLWQEIKASAFWVFPVFFASFYVHEWLHALGFMAFGGVPRDAISIRLDWKNFDIQTRCGAPMTAGAYRLSALLPMLAMGVIPAVLSLVYGIGWLAFWSILALSGVVSDLLQVWVIRNMNSSDRVALTIDASAEDRANSDINGSNSTSA